MSRVVFCLKLQKELEGLAKPPMPGDLGQKIFPEAALEIAKRARGTPRIVKRLVRRVIDFALYKKCEIDGPFAAQALDFVGIDSDGLDWLDRKILVSILVNFNNRPIGLETLSATIGEDKETVELYAEPFLLRIGLLERTPRGRKIVDGKVNFLRDKLLGQKTIL